MQEKYPQDERYRRQPDGSIRRFAQPQSSSQSHFVPQPPPPQPDPPPKKRPRKKRRHAIWLYIFALIGFLFVAVECFRYLIVPLLVQLHIWTGGRL